MGEKIQLKRGIYKVNFGYHSKRGGYTMLMSDIPNYMKLPALNKKLI